MKTENLARYIDDHLVGSHSALELIEDLAGREQSSAGRSAFLDLHERVKADQSLLSRLLAMLGLKSDALIAESKKSSRLREMWSGLKPGEVGVLEAVELLVLAITSKRLLWMALQEIAPSHPMLAGVDFKRMQDDAREQRGLLERGFGLQPA